MFYLDLSKNKHVIYLYLSAFLNNEDSALDLIYEKTLVVTYPFDPSFIFTSEQTYFDKLNVTIQKDSG